MKEGKMFGPPIVGPFDANKRPHCWSWIYFHLGAEELNDKWQEDQESGWTAPDLVYSDTPVEKISDGRFVWVRHCSGQDITGFIWSHSPRWNPTTERMEGQRKGLIVLLDDEEALVYASKAEKEKRSCL